MKSDLRLATDVLLNRVCQCGRAKQVRQAVCSQCWKRLPVDARNELYSRAGSGFGTAYKKACELLRGSSDSPAVMRAKAQLGF